MLDKLLIELQMFGIFLIVNGVAVLIFAAFTQRKKDDD